MGFSRIKEHGFESIVGGFLKMDGAFNHLSKFVCLKQGKVNGPLVWSLGHVITYFLQSLDLNKDAS